MTKRTRLSVCFQWVDGVVGDWDWVNDWVESRRGAVTAMYETTAPFPLPAHQTGRADFQHPAFRQNSYDAHAAFLSRTRRTTPSFPKISFSGNLLVPSVECL